MKKLIFTIWILVLAVTININRAEGQWVPTGPYGGDYINSSSSGGNLFLNLPESVWGEYKLVRSTDEGINWDVIGSWMNESHTSLKATDSFVFRGTTDGVIYRTSNNGLSWDILETGTISPGSPVTSIDYLNGILFTNVAGFGIYKSTNNGDNWTGVFNNPNLYIKSFASAGGYIYAADRSGIIRGDNSLLNWTTVFSDTGLVFNNIINFGTDLFASTTSKGITRSSDYGNTWEYVNAGLSNLSVSSVKSSGVNLFASTIGGGVFMSSNNGVNWTPVNKGLPYSKVYDLFFSDTRIFAGAGSGGIFYSTDNGDNWLNLNVKFQTFGLNTMVSNNSYIFTGGYPGIFRTSDNGNSWLFLDKASPMQTVSSLTTKDNFLFNASGSTGVFRSSDNGSNWIETNNGLNGNQISSMASNSGYVFAAGGYPVKMFRSSDNGDNWISITNGLAAGDIYQIFSTETALLIGTSNGVFYSSNNGTNWNGSSLNGKLVHHITYNGIFVFALVIGDGVYRSSDNGGSWILVYSGQPEPWIFSITSSGSNIFLGGQDNILYSSDNADSWNTINEGYPPQQPLSYFLFISRDYIFNGMNFGYSIWKRPISDIFQTPLSGTYTVGSGGTYPTINSAINAAKNLGISGPVNFEIISGTYNESVSIPTIPGSSSINTLTLKSQSGNSADVYISGGFNIHSTNVVINKLTIGDLNDTIKFGGSNIKFTDNNFNSAFLFLPTDYANSRDIFFSRNINIGKVFFYGDFLFNFYPTNIHFNENKVIGEFFMGYCKDVFIEKNLFEGNIDMFSNNMNIIKNKITGNHISVAGNIFNNFMNGTININGKILNNTFVGGTSIDPTVKCYNSYLLNNIIINPYGGTAVNFYWGIQFSECNNLYNGGNNNLIQFEDTLYNSVNDFYNATGFEYHSSSLPVSFVSSFDLHLAGTSVGDEGLIGISSALISDDIDDDPRSTFYPYKGADEADILLPVELNSFTAIVSNSNVRINWATSSEINNSGFDIERSIIKDRWTKAGFVEGTGNSNEPKDYSFIDKNLAPGKYNYRLKQIDFNGNYKYFNLSAEVTIGIPEKYELSQNYPNPFNPVTNLEFAIPELGFVSLKVYDVLGKEVITLVNEIKQAGRYQVEFDGSNFASGVYFYELRSGNFVSQKRMLLLK